MIDLIPLGTEDPMAQLDSGVVVAAGPNGLMEAFLKAMTGHRHFERVIEGVSA